MNSNPASWTCLLNNSSPYTAPSELQSFEKWIISRGLWAEQPTLALLTTCSSTAPRGLAAGNGAEPATTSVKSMSSERVTPLDHPTNQALAEMIDPYEVLLCWFYSSPDGSIDNDDVDDEAELACFVAYHDEGERHKPSSDVTAGKDADERRNKRSLKPFEIEKKCSKIDAKARDSYQDIAEGMPEDSCPASGGGSNANDMNEEIDANDFDTGVLRVRVILSGPGTLDKLRQATKGFLSAMKNRNPVRRFHTHRIVLFIGVCRTSSSFDWKILSLRIMPTSTNEPTSR